MHLTAGGIDTYLVRYFTAIDDQGLDPEQSTRESRNTYTTGRFEGWTKRISSVVTAIIDRPDSSSRIGLLGFSLGGYVAADTAANDDRVTAIAVLYGGMPDAMVAQVKHLPPLIELHGEADRIVPLAKGRRTRKPSEGGWSTSRASHLSRSGARVRFLGYRPDDR